MMMRSDGKKLPIGCIPVGSGDDFCGMFGMEVNDLVTAIKYIKSGQTIRADCIKV